MFDRITLYRLMVCAPAVLVSGIAVQSRTFEDDYLPVKMTAEQNARIEAYIPFVKEASDAARQPDPDLWRATATHWIDADREGKLKEVFPIAFDDVSTEGAKDSIFTSKLILSRRLAHFAYSPIVREEPKLAAKDLVLSIQLSEVGKFSDFNTVQTSAILQRIALHSLAKILPKLSPADLTDVRCKLVALAERQKSLDAISISTKSLYREWMHRKGQVALGLDQGEKFVAANGGSSTNDYATTGASLLVAGLSDEIPKYVSMASLAQGVQDGFVKDLAKTLGKN
jgi:hypothetical protein